MLLCHLGGTHLIQPLKLYHCRTTSPTRQAFCFILHVAREIHPVDFDDHHIALVEVVGKLLKLREVVTEQADGVMQTCWCHNMAPSWHHLVALDCLHRHVAHIRVVVLSCVGDHGVAISLLLSLIDLLLRVVISKDLDTLKISSRCLRSVGPNWDM